MDKKAIENFNNLPDDQKKNALFRAKVQPLGDFSRQKGQEQQIYEQFNESVTSCIGNDLSICNKEEDTVKKPFVQKVKSEALLKAFVEKIIKSGGVDRLIVKGNYSSGL